MLDVDAEHLSATDRAGIGEALNLALARRLDLEVQSARALQARAQLGAEQQAVGCDTTACLAEVANAMGARYVAFTRVVRLGDNQLIRLDLFDSTTGSTLAFASQQGSLQAVFTGIDALVDTVLLDASALPLRKGAAVSANSGGGGVDVVGIVVGSAGVAVAGGVATAVGLLSWFAHAEAVQRVLEAEKDKGDASAAQADQVAAREAWQGQGRLFTIVGGAVAGVGVVALVGGLGFALTRPVVEEEAQ